MVRPELVSRDLSNASGPNGADHELITVADVEFEGVDPTFSDAIRKAVDPLRRVRTSVAKFYQLANSVQSLYAERGYFLTRVIIPPQTVHNGGVLRIKVCEGYIAELDVRALAPHLRATIDGALRRLVGRPKLTRAEFDRAVYLASDIPGLSLKFALSPAHANLGVTVSVSGAYEPVAARIAFDNYLPHSLGGVETTASTIFNSTLGFGEEVYFTAGTVHGYGGLTASNPYRQIAAGITTPIFYDGLNLNLETASSTTRPFALPGQLAVASLYRRVSAKLSYSVVRESSINLRAHAGLNEVDEFNEAVGFGQTLYRDHLTVLRSGLDGDYSSPFGTLMSTGFELSQGLPILGARGSRQATAEEPISRTGASASFSKIEMHVQVRQDLFSDLAINITGRFQSALNGPLFNSEKFSLGGASDLSGFDDGAFSGDGGWVTRAELQFAPRSFGSAGTPSFRPYIFAARGQVYTLQPTAAEARVVGGDSFGIGLRATTLNPSALSIPADVSLEAARALADQTAQAYPGWRINLAVTARF